MASGVGARGVSRPAANGLLSRVELFVFFRAGGVAPLVQLKQGSVAKMQGIAEDLKLAVVEDGGGPAAIEIQVAEKLEFPLRGAIAEIRQA